MWESLAENFGTEVAIAVLALGIEPDVESCYIMARQAQSRILCIQKILYIGSCYFFVPNLAGTNIFKVCEILF